jgi:uncharacterized protein YndB with AHSA1/START domain
MSQHATLQIVDGDPAIRFERTFTQPIETVWAAITEPEHLEHWFPSTIDGPRATGAAVEFRFRDPEESKWDFAGTILEYDPPEVFALQWGPEALCFQLTAEGTGTRMVFTATFGDPGIVARDTAGWHACLDALDEHVVTGGGRAPGTEPTPQWQAYFDHYREAFGGQYAVVAEATAMG